MLYRERLTSNRTTFLFVALSALFAALGAWNWVARGLNGWGIASLILALVFLFYVINYRTLVIELTPQALTLKFGLFSWRVPAENIAAIRHDSPPFFMRYGGAGIHFMFVDRRYRASFNFLEYPRVAIALKRKAGPVQDISFSTRQPDQLIQLIRSHLLLEEPHP